MTYTTNKRPARRYNGFMAPAFSTIVNELLHTPLSEAVEKARLHTRPAANISKTDEAFMVMLSLPGVKKEEIDISVNEQVLTVKSVPKETDERSFRLREFDYSNFKRAFTLPKHVDAAAIAAKYEAGVLTLTLPIAPEAKPKTIEIL